jgi:ABC transporter substrate binding protein (PQQ-dependent alcohol dehydrogenase system)
MKRPNILLCAVVLCLVLGSAFSISARAQNAVPEEQKISIGYLHVTGDEILPLSRIDVPPKDSGIAGAQLGIKDSQTTGRFTKQDFALTVENAANEDEALKALDKLLAAGTKLIVVDSPSAVLLKLSDRAGAEGALLFNISSADDSLRAENCRANMFHIVPSRNMLADGLAQFLVWKKWRRWFLLSGVHPDDTAFAGAIKRAAKRFGAQIVEERFYKESGGARRTDTGTEQVQEQIPVFTQRAPEHDVAVVADESEVFGAYIPYRAWDPRPVVGTAGLVPTTWHPAHEGWGATQLQSRFERSAKRYMTPLDYQAWEAVRLLGEAAIRTKSSDLKTVRAFMLKPDFGLGAFKGQAVNFRTWDRQLRQPILLADLQMVVSVSPQPGFLHQFYETDTLGMDQPESKCTVRG